MVWCRVCLSRLSVSFSIPIYISLCTVLCTFWFPMLSLQDFPLTHGVINGLCSPQGKLKSVWFLAKLFTLGVRHQYQRRLQKSKAKCLTNTCIKSKD